MTEVRSISSGIATATAEIKSLPGGPPVPTPTLVQADQATILGDGSHERPLHAPPSPPPPPGFDSFTYSVTGIEADPSEIAIALPIARADTSYVVFAGCQGVANISPFDITSKTTTGFIVVATGDLTAGDVIAFLVVPI